MHTDTELRKEIDDFLENIIAYSPCKRYNEMVKLELRLNDLSCPLVVAKILQEYRENGKFSNCEVTTPICN